MVTLASVCIKIVKRPCWVMVQAHSQCCILKLSSIVWSDWPSSLKAHQLSRLTPIPCLPSGRERLLIYLSLQKPGNIYRRLSFPMVELPMTYMGDTLGFWQCYISINAVRLDRKKQRQDKVKKKATRLESWNRLIKLLSCRHTLLFRDEKGWLWGQSLGPRGRNHRHGGESYLHGVRAEDRAVSLEAVA